MHSLVRAAFAVWLLQGLVAGPATALFIDTPGGIYDSATDAVWAPSERTLGLSVEGFLNGDRGLLAEGWRLATTADVCSMTLGNLSGGGYSTCPGAGSDQEFRDPGQGIREAFGPTGETLTQDPEGSSGSSFLLAAFDDGDLSDGAGQAGYVLFFSNGPPGPRSTSRIRVEPNLVGVAEASSGRALFILYRPVPEPVAGLFLGVAAPLVIGRARARTRSV